ncbi:tail fiber assembly protein [Pseudomonas chlororaphis]|uniref:tail fiber assembly protein n=1 Tax=Pseudomonas chlororaphis TaxID=587753 RepID=UPI0039E33248
MFYAASTNGFYNGWNDSIPLDVVEIDIAYHAELIQGQSDGQMIAAGEDGYPVLKDRPPISPEQIAERERQWRDSQLTETDGVVARHRDELEEGVETTLSAAQYAELQSYRRALRQWPESGEFPLIDHRPIAPPWLAEQLQ